MTIYDPHVQLRTANLQPGDFSHIKEVRSECDSEGRLRDIYVDVEVKKKSGRKGNSGEHKKTSRKPRVVETNMVVTIPAQRGTDPRAAARYVQDILGAGVGASVSRTQEQCRFIGVYQAQDSQEVSAPVSRQLPVSHSRGVVSHRGPGAHVQDQWERPAKFGVVPSEHSPKKLPQRTAQLAHSQQEASVEADTHPEHQTSQCTVGKEQYHSALSLLNQQELSVGTLAPQAPDSQHYNTVPSHSSPQEASISEVTLPEHQTSQTTVDNEQYDSVFSQLNQREPAVGPLSSQAPDKQQYHTVESHSSPQEDSSDEVTLPEPQSRTTLGNELYDSVLSQPHPRESAVDPLSVLTPQTCYSQQYLLAPPRLSQQEASVELLSLPPTRSSAYQHDRTSNRKPLVDPFSVPTPHTRDSRQYHLAQSRLSQPEASAELFSSPTPRSSAYQHDRTESRSNNREPLVDPFSVPTPQTRDSRQYHLAQPRHSQQEESVEFFSSPTPRSSAYQSAVPFQVRKDLAGSQDFFSVVEAPLAVEQSQPLRAYPLGVDTSSPRAAGISSGATCAQDYSLDGLTYLVPEPMRPPNKRLLQKRTHRVKSKPSLPVVSSRALFIDMSPAAVADWLHRMPSTYLPDNVFYNRKLNDLRVAILREKIDGKGFNNLLQQERLADTGVRDIHSRSFIGKRIRSAWNAELC